MSEMVERRYTVSEIDALRMAVENKWLYGRYSGPVFDKNSRRLPSRCYRAEERILAVEQMVRTHMLAGHSADDLYASEC